MPTPFEYREIKGKDRFVHPNENKGDKWFIVITLILTIIFISSLIGSVSNKAYGDIYTPIALLSGIMLLGAIITKGKLLLNEVVFGKIQTERELFIELGIGIAFGAVAFAIVDVIGGGLLSIAGILPLAVTSATAITLSAYFLVGFVAPLAEDGLIQQLLIPTVASMLNNPFVLAVISFIAGIIFIGAVPNTLLLGFIFVLIGLAFLGLHVLQVDLSKSDGTKHLIAALFGATVGGIYHFYSYSLTNSNPYGALFVAGVFFFVFALEDWQRQNTLSGMMSHSVFNMLLLTVLLSAPPTYLLVVLFIFVAVIYATFKAGRWK